MDNRHPNHTACTVWLSSGVPGSPAQDYRQSLTSSDDRYPCELQQRQLLNAASPAPTSGAVQEWELQEATTAPRVPYRTLLANPLTSCGIGATARSRGGSSRH